MVVINERKAKTDKINLNLTRNLTDGVAKSVNLIVQLFRASLLFQFGKFVCKLQWLHASFDQNVHTRRLERETCARYLPPQLVNRKMVFCFDLLEQRFLNSVSDC